MSIELKRVTKEFDDNTIIDNFSYTFENGKSYALIGPSGSGKTTLLNIIAHIDKPTGGEILIDQIDYQKIKELEFYRDYLGYIFQNFGLIEKKTVKQNLLMLPLSKDFKKNIDDKLIPVLKQVGLDETFLKRSVASLSGGQAQRVAIARNILKNPKIIVADEPSAALDEKNTNMIMELLKKQINNNTVLIVATHDPNVYSQLDEVINLS
ncbi:MAG: ATP-binding cassette domain-containing protein [Lactobacillaceae bacterium]|jgi:putative ABC transport system ATP-binding protein|nr:ATP-binding cassette domain-containing protein [Lactobacillaceae bacterium]